MSETLHVELPEGLREFVEQRVRKGDYPSVGDYLSDLIERDRAAADAADRLRALIQQGIDSGPARSLSRQDWAELRKRALRSAA